MVFDQNLFKQTMLLTSYYGEYIMAEIKVDVLIEGGKASAAPPLGPALGPTGVNIGQVVGDINTKTADFKGMKVPVTVTVDTESKTYEISIGTPPAAQLIKQEAGVKTAAANPITDKVANLMLEQVMKIASMKQDSLLGSDVKARCREIIGTCQSMGILIEGKEAQVMLKEIANGDHDAKLMSGKTELTAEEKAKLEEEKAKMAAKLKKRNDELTAQAQAILDTYSDAKKARNKMKDAGIPQTIIDKLAPQK